MMFAVIWRMWFFECMYRCMRDVSAYVLGPDYLRTTCAQVTIRLRVSVRMKICWWSRRVSHKRAQEGRREREKKREWGSQRSLRFDLWRDLELGEWSFESLTSFFDHSSLVNGAFPPPLIEEICDLLQWVLHRGCIIRHNKWPWHKLPNKKKTTCRKNSEPRYRNTGTKNDENYICTILQSHRNNIHLCLILIISNDISSSLISTNKMVKTISVMMSHNHAYYRS